MGSKQVIKARPKGSQLALDIWMKDAESMVGVKSSEKSEENSPCSTLNSRVMDDKEQNKRTKVDNLMEKEVMEPVCYKGKPKWLMVKNNVFELKTPGLWECMKCGERMQSDLNKPVKCSNATCTSTDFTVVTDVIDPDSWKPPKWEDIPAEELDMEKVYDDMLALVKKCVIFPETIHYKLFVLWIISSWKVES